MLSKSFLLSTLVVIPTLVRAEGGTVAVSLETRDRSLATAVMWDKVDGVLAGEGVRIASSSLRMTFSKKDGQAVGKYSVALRVTDLRILVSRLTVVTSEVPQLRVNELMLSGQRQKRKAGPTDVTWSVRISGSFLSEPDGKRQFLPMLLNSLAGASANTDLGTLRRVEANRVDELVTLKVILGGNGWQSVVKSADAVLQSATILEIERESKGDVHVKIRLKGRLKPPTSK